jgi:hypothetical protein
VIVSWSSEDVVCIRDILPGRPCRSKPLQCSQLWNPGSQRRNLQADARICIDSSGSPELRDRDTIVHVEQAVIESLESGRKRLGHLRSQ